MKAATTVDAKKIRIGPDEAVAMARNFDEIYASKGTRLVHLNLKKEQVDDDELKKLLIGPSGNLRAPTLQVGKALLIGFNEESYSKLLK